MSDQHAAGSLPELTPEQEEEVRRLLADARHDEPIPTDVGDRLDTVLAGLTRDEPGSPGVAPVIDLAARRRRRNAAAVLAGAAAVIVAGFVGAQVIDVSPSEQSDSAGAGSAADRETSTKHNLESGNDAGDESQEPGPASAPEASSDIPLQLRSTHLRDDVRTQLRAAYSANTTDGVDQVPVAGLAAIGCTSTSPAAKYGLGDLFPALFDGKPVVLAVRPPSDGVQQADVLACDTAASLASVTIPSR